MWKRSSRGCPTAPGARIFRVRYVNVVDGDYSINGVVDNEDYAVWKSTFGSNLLLAADGNGDGVVNAADYTVWRDRLGAAPAAAATSETAPALAVASVAAIEPAAIGGSAAEPAQPVSAAPVRPDASRLGLSFVDVDRVGALEVSGRPAVRPSFADPIRSDVLDLALLAVLADNEPGTARSDRSVAVLAENGEAGEEQITSPFEELSAAFSAW